jgi:hypothetical protein
VAPARKSRELSRPGARKNAAEQGARDFPGADGSNESSTEIQAANEAGADPQNGSPVDALLDANPELRRAWEDAEAYRSVFGTPEEARQATARLADLNRLDALFFSARPEDHAELARTVAALEPAAFSSLVRAMNQVASSPEAAAQNAKPAETQANSKGGLAAAQAQFLQSANAATIERVNEAIAAQLEKLLPEGAPAGARDRMAREIYRELDGALQSNRELGKQVRDLVRSGSFDAGHQSALVSLLASRARQALPAVARRVLGEWTSALLSASRDRQARQRSAERRVDIAGSGGKGTGNARSLSPREIDYARMSDADILNL